MVLLLVQELCTIQLSTPFRNDRAATAADGAADTHDYAVARRDTAFNHSFGLFLTLRFDTDLRGLGTIGNISDFSDFSDINDLCNIYGSRGDRSIAARAGHRCNGLDSEYTLMPELRREHEVYREIQTLLLLLVPLLCALLAPAEFRSRHRCVPGAGHGAERDDTECQDHNTYTDPNGAVDTFDTFDEGDDGDHYTHIAGGDNGHYHIPLTRGLDTAPPTRAIRPAAVRAL